MPKRPLDDRKIYKNLHVKKREGKWGERVSEREGQKKRGGDVICKSVDNINGKDTDMSSA